MLGIPTTTYIKIYARHWRIHLLASALDKSVPPFSSQIAKKDFGHKRSNNNQTIVGLFEHLTGSGVFASINGIYASVFSPFDPSLYVDMRDMDIAHSKPHNCSIDACSHDDWNAPWCCYLICVYPGGCVFWLRRSLSCFHECFWTFRKISLVAVPLLF